MRFLKQIFYGIFYLCVLTAIIFGVYKLYFYKSPTCSDGLLNQNETSVDCGGECISCELKNATLNVETMSVMRAGDGKVTFIGFVKNQSDYSAVFEYEVRLVGEFDAPLIYSTKGISSIGPFGDRPIVIPGINAEILDVSTMDMEILKTEWNTEPGVGIQELGIVNVETVIVGDSIRVTGRILNDSPDSVKRARITALITDEYGSPYAASAVEISDIRPSDERPFTVFFPKEFVGVESDQLYTDVFAEIVRSL